MLKSESMRIRTSPAEKQAWAEAAGGTGKISEWLRGLANQAAWVTQPNIAAQGGQVELGPADRRIVLSTEQDASLGKKTIKDVAAKQCPRAHHHRPNMYCGRCEKVPK